MATRKASKSPKKSVEGKAARRASKAANAAKSRKTAKPAKGSRKAAVKPAARKSSKSSSAKPAKGPIAAPKKVAKRSVAVKARKAAKPAAKSAAKSAPRAKPVAPLALKSPPAERQSQPQAASRPLRIALFGASGHVGSRIAEEAVNRGHSVTALVRHPDQMDGEHPGLRKVRGDVTDPLQSAIAARNHDIVVSAISPPDNELAVLSYAAKSLLSAAKETGKRVVVVGGAGSLEVKPGLQLLDSPQFPTEWRPIAVAHRDALKVFQSQGQGAPWTVVSPAAFFEPGERTGKYRAGTDQLLTDKKGVSRISMEDYAIGVVDEVERAANVGKRITFAY